MENLKDIILLILQSTPYNYTEQRAFLIYQSALKNKTLEELYFNLMRGV